MKARVFASVLSLSLLVPIAAPAQRQGSGGGHGGAAPPAGGGQRGGAPRSGGFNLNRDLNAPQQRPAAPAQRYNPPPQIARPPVARPPVLRRPTVRPPVVANHNRRPIVDPRYRGQRQWTWNRGVVWAPAPTYWGGGFWGPFAFGAAAVAIGATLYGSFADPATSQDYASYEVAPGSPGAELLANYQLTQTPCGPPNLVVIFGPDNSVICAAPNDQVAPGEYDLDPSTLSLVGQ
jgi:hypothetical protein